MICPLCKGAMTKGSTNLPYELGKGEMIVIQDVPAFVCKQCGESFLEIQVTQVVEKLVSTAKQDGMTLGFIRYQRAA
ncbi:MAG: type II toxin-antitoxin system MqsA family antitoxin [Deltaproteobacteria bacterium]|nr:type II toxin-antitoxin system MqsA family antitoxin [Deltaproteobacteria bacterium]